MKAVLSLLLLVSALVVRGTEEGVLRFWWNRGWSDGVWSSSGLGAHYAWHKQELWKGRAAWYAGIGTTSWSGWGFKSGLLGVRSWSAADANAGDNP